MKILLVFISLLFVSQQIVSQSTQSIENLGLTYDEIVFENDEIQIRSYFKKCDDPSVGLERDYIILTIQNYKNYDLYVEFDQELYYDQKCKTCDNNEYHFTYRLGPKEVISGKCHFDSIAGLRIFHGMPEKWLKEKLSDFKLLNIKTKRI
jgi:hypothetical protein